MKILLKTITVISALFVVGCSIYSEPTTGEVAQLKLVAFKDNVVPFVNIHPNGMCNPRLGYGGLVTEEQINQGKNELKAELLIQANQKHSVSFHALAPDGKASSCDIAVSFTPSPNAEYELKYFFDHEEEQCVVVGTEVIEVNGEASKQRIQDIEKEESAICFI
ncbi:hypothetical protein PVK64_15260 [Aliivibrio sp. S4TY2]|uniref:hypothetical protein n=1 Tax=unclassified Aliivibrio TaxID=2645654 RepID=UPI002377DC7C|nr:MULTISPECIES: hypothetical protein [unclassified Aliivibrio]MDD9157529.1 hypothetical protein [Aliivibrio sp. S4TY2]MDD9161278.1 hypothetical protein [Aliivibrio sp. S4TY1]MDD9165308.1 hypothetical protein [Aliivibrio sp. S4MY2]MDD9169438.1 hypothetical protein [Aliivibrio sp. S4MY4]MDD9186431.1 hypothetical protein [Aliivibrio sp. S4MY3]